MAREIKEIKSAMTTQFMSDENLATAYGFTPGVEFDDTFSTVSIESILFYMVACAIYLLEVIFDTFKADINTTIAQAMVPSTYFYRAIAQEFQPGVDLIFDETTQSFRYETIDASNQPIAFAACRDASTFVRILVAAADTNSLPTSLDAGTLDLFKIYINKRKPAGVVLKVMTAEPDLIKISAEVQINRLLLNLDGSLISDPATFPVRNAVNAYLASIDYNLGVFNKTKCVDAIQNVPGVVDVTLGSVMAKTFEAVDYAAVTTNNYTAYAGCIQSNNLNSTLTYVA